jgi:ribonuclease HI
VKIRSKVTLITDGSCIGNPGPGGWAYRLEFDDGSVFEDGGRESATTNQRMELTAALQGLLALDQPSEVALISDSRYLVTGLDRWRHDWVRREWTKINGAPVANQDLWKALNILAEKHHISCKWVPAHSGHEGNERCDDLASMLAESALTDLVMPVWSDSAA